jgi:thioredoxin reductase (NADPH)
MSELVVYGAPWCPDCRRSKKFLAEHRVPFRWVDIDEDPEALAYVERVQNGGRTIPMIELPDGGRLFEPGDDELARAMGLRLAAERHVYDLVIVGGGPAGLAAAIYAAREGIETLVVDKAGLGGQAGVTDRIDNYPGFPDGVPGAELADRFIAQARRYGVELLAAVEVTGVERDDPGGPGTGASDVEGGALRVSLGNGQQVGAYAVLLAPGSSYRRLGIPGEEELIGSGVHFCATCDGPFYRGTRELLVVGGGNSALEEGLFLTQFAQHVRLVARGEVTASRLLQDKVTHHPGMTVHTQSTVESFAGSGGRLTEVVVRTPDGPQRFHPSGAFIFIGLDPNTGWLGDTVDRDPWGFIRTDGTFATSLPGVFAAGDARAGATKQLGSAVGDGIAALLGIRSYLQAHSDLRRLDVNS